MSAPVVSVIIPCYNAEKNLMQCIDSVCGQTLEQIEIICIDDGSTDSTLDILLDYQRKDSRILVIQQKNAGAGAARNIGLDRASGTYLSFLDADDFFEPDMLEKSVAAAEKYKADYIVFRANRYYPTEDCYKEIPWSVRNVDLPPYMPFTYRQLTDNIFLSFVGWAWDKLFRRSFVLEHHLWFQEQRTTNDMLFVFSALICAKRIAVIQDVLAHQRRGSSDSLSVTREKSWHCFYDALIALRERLYQENLYWELEQDFINYALHFSLWHLNSLAEPTRTKLERKLRSEWFAELGIMDKPVSYFYSREEYAQFKKISGKAVPSNKRDNLPLYRENLPEEDTMGVASSLVSDKQTADAIWRQYDMLRDQLMVDSETWVRYQNDYWWRKYQQGIQACRQLPKNIADQYFQRLCRELNRAQQLKQIDKRYFSHREWQCMQKMICRCDGRISMLRSIPIVRWCSAFIPKALKKKLIYILKSKK